MPVDFLTVGERDRLKNFPSEIPDNDVRAYFTLSKRDIEVITRYNAMHNRIGFALQMCTLRYLGFIPLNFLRVPSDVISYISKQLKISPEVLKNYEKRPQTRSDHQKAIMEYLGYRNVEAQDLSTAATWLVDRALEHDRPTLLVEMVCKKFYDEKIVRPGITVIERLVASSRKRAELVTYRHLIPILTGEMKDFLDKLLISENRGLTSFSWLRKKPELSTASSILAALDKLEFLILWGVDSWDFSAVNPNRIKLLSQIGKKSTNYDLSRMSESKRYPVLLASLKQFRTEITDEIIEMYDRCLADIDAKARRELEEFRKKVAKSTNEKVKLLEDIATIILDTEAIGNDLLRSAIYQHIPKQKLEIVVEECRRIRRPMDDNHYDFLGKRYGHLRKFVPRFFHIIDFHSNLKHGTLLEAIEVMRQLDQNQKRHVPFDAPITFVSPKWKAYVIDNGGNINRRYYELCTLYRLRESIRSGDIWIKGSRRYRDMESYLIADKHWKKIRKETCRQMQVPLNGETRLEERQKELETLLARVDRKLWQNKKVRIEDGRIVIAKVRAETLPISAKKLRKIVTERLPRVELTSLLIEVDSWTNFSRHFEHAGGSQPRNPDLMTYLYASILTQAFNFGLSDMTKSADLSYSRLAWCTSWYLREETLKPAFTDIVNFQYQQSLSFHWGGGTLSSSDGQRFPASRKTRKATANPRYFGYEQGITYHSWTSDQFSQYGTKPAPSTIRDATYVLDGIMDNETELPILEHTTDTAGYTYLVFALFDLLGLKFSPRIRDIGDQSLYYFSSNKYRKLGKILQKKINKDLILSNWDDFLRIAGSIKLGWVTTSLFVNKLQGYPRQNILTRALQEYGRIEKTIFILRYLESEEYRRYIGKQLNKGEALHDLRNFLRIKKGKIKRKQDEELLNQALCLNLVTNAVITWNTVYMAAVIEQLKREGFAVYDSDIAHLSPTRYEHINPYGKYQFCIDEEFSRKTLRPLRKP